MVPCAEFLIAPFLCLGMDSEGVCAVPQLPSLNSTCVSVILARHDSWVPVFLVDLSGSSPCCCCKMMANHHLELIHCGCDACHFLLLPWRPCQMDLRSGLWIQSALILRMTGHGTKMKRCGGASESPLPHWGQGVAPAVGPRTGSSRTASRTVVLLHGWGNGHWAGAIMG